MKENLINVQMSEEFYNEKFLKMGGAGTAESTMAYYLKPTTLDDAFSEMVGFAAQIVKADIGQKVVAAPLFLLELGGSLFNYIIAFGVNPDMKLVLPNHTGTVSEIYGNTLATYTEITEDEFYNLSSEEDSGGLKEGDVLYYRIVTPLNHTGLISNVNSGNLITGITQLAVSSCINENSGNSYFNQFWDSWTLNQNNTIKNGSLVAETINAVKFTVGADNKDLIAVSNSDKDITDSEKYFIQITKEEYDNIFNS